MKEELGTPNFWAGKSVFLTGHTGFKGGWLALWLQLMGARVHGYSLPPPTETNLFEIAKIETGMASSTIADIRDHESLQAAVEKTQPEIVFHLAAQPLVRRSYVDPVETYEVNVMGTVHLFEAVRSCPSVKALINVTTDKCYDNKEWDWGYRESDPMGGADPYSSSKGCVELLTAAYRRSFFEETDISVASARAGNVIGGGDWASDRLIPDFLRAITAGETLEIRSPFSIRPWQHVLEPLSGYILLAEKLASGNRQFAEGWNFGPEDSDARPVQWIVEELSTMHKGVSWRLDEKTQPHEANYLKLDSSKAHNRLSWRPRWRLNTALQKTLEWHNAWLLGKDMHQLTISQIKEYGQLNL
jgi:CDP-glucose 4,6-dehydratase